MDNELETLIKKRDAIYEEYLNACKEVQKLQNSYKLQNKYIHFVESGCMFVTNQYTTKDGIIFQGFWFQSSMNTFASQFYFNVEHFHTLHFTFSELKWMSDCNRINEMTKEEFIAEFKQVSEWAKNQTLDTMKVY